MFCIERKGRGVRLVCLGDSITYGYGISKDRSWFALLDKVLCCELINHGVNGATVFDMIYFFQEEVIYEAATDLLLMGGINDLLMGRTSKTVGDRIEDIVKLCVEHKIAPKLATLIEPTEGIVREWDFEEVKVRQIIQKTREVNDRILELCRSYNLDCIDVGAIFREARDRDALLMDGLHPNEEGHRRMFEYIRAFYTEYLREEGKMDE